MTERGAQIGHKAIVFVHPEGAVDILNRLHEGRQPAASGSVSRTSGGNTHRCTVQWTTHLFTMSATCSQAKSEAK